MKDEPYNDGLRIVMMDEELGIKGLHVFGRHLAGHVIPATEAHYHKDCFEFAYVTKGSILFQVDNKDYRLSGGDIFVTSPNEVHGIGVLPMAINEMYWFQLDVSEPEGFLSLELDWARMLIEEMNRLHSRVIKVDNREMSYLMRDFCDIMTVSQRETRYEAIGLLLVFLHRMLRYDKQTRFNLTPDIARAVEYTLDNLTEEIALEELADICELSLSRFKQKFKQQMGMTPREFVNYHKIELAKGQLEEGCSITDIAMELGFTTSNYFSVVFKRFTSFSPSEYMRRNQPMPPKISTDSCVK